VILTLKLHEHSMSKKTLEEIEAEMDALTGRLSALSVEHQAARQRQSHQSTRESLSEREQYKALLRKMVGRKVLIAVNGKHKGKEGIITRHVGDTFHPVNWYVRLPDGSETRKHNGSFKLLPLDSTSESK